MKTLSNAHHMDKEKAPSGARKRAPTEVVRSIRDGGLMAANGLKFPSLDIEQKSAECIAKLDACVQGQFDALIDRFLDQFEQYCGKITRMQEAGQKGAVGFIYGMNRQNQAWCAFR